MELPPRFHRLFDISEYIDSTNRSSHNDLECDNPHDRCGEHIIAIKIWKTHQSSYRSSSSNSSRFTRQHAVKRVVPQNSILFMGHRRIPVIYKWNLYGNLLLNNEYHLQV